MSDGVSNLIPKKNYDIKSFRSGSQKSNSRIKQHDRHSIEQPSGIHVFA